VSPTEATTRRTPALVLPAVVAVIAVLLAALAAVAAMRRSDELAGSVSSPDRIAEAIAAASNQVSTVLSYDYRHLDEDFARATALLTPRFRKSYLSTTAKSVKPLAEKYKAISSAQVTSAGLVEGSADRVVVLVFVAQTATNSQLTAPRLDRSRIKTTLVRSGDRWLIDNLQPV
jgi:Mce-associated membrane protein